MANEAARTYVTGSAGILLSALFHAATFMALGMVRIDPASFRTEPVVVSVVDEPPPNLEEPAPAAVAPEPEPEPAKPPPRVKEAAPKPVETPPPEQAQNTPPAPAEETIADFSGTTLTAEGEGGWASAVGSGAAMNGPIGRPNAVVTGRNRQGVQGGVIGGTGLRVLGDADLSRRPVPPSEDARNAALQRNFPKDARQLGIEGVARVKVRILPSGKLEPLATVSETYPGFADACKRSLRELRFEPPLDRQGTPVATDITYACTFVVE